VSYEPFHFHRDGSRKLEALRRRCRGSVYGAFDQSMSCIDLGSLAIYTREAVKSSMLVGWSYAAGGSFSR